MNAPATMTATREFLTSGPHLGQLAVSGAREQVRRAAIGLAPLNRYDRPAAGGRHD